MFVQFNLYNNLIIDKYSIHMRVGSGRVGSHFLSAIAGRVGSGRVNVLPGRVGSKKSDPWTTLCTRH